LSSLRFPSVLILFCLASLSVSAQNIALANAASSWSYEEEISLEIRPPSGQVLLAFIFTNVSGLPLDISDFTNEPSFISIVVSCTNSPDDNRTVVMVGLNTSIVSVSLGKLKADIMKTKVEDLFGVTLPYTGNFTSDSTVTYSYRINDCPSIQKFRDVFIELKPSDGFGKIITPSSIGNYVAFMFMFHNGDLPYWTVGATLNYPNYFSYGLGQECTISLKGLTGYSGTIQSSPESSKSTLHISISQVDKDYKLISFDTAPSQMDKTQGTYGGGTSLMFEKITTGSSVDDLSLHFKIVSPNYIDPTTIAIYVGIVVVVVLGIVVFIIRRKIRRLNWNR